MAIVMREPIKWKTSALTLIVSFTDSGTPCIEHLIPDGSCQQEATSRWFKSSSIGVDGVRSNGDGHSAIKTAKALVGSYLSQRLVYDSHDIARTESTESLRIVSVDATLGIRVEHHFITYASIPALRSYATITNMNKTSVPITQLSSLTIGGLTKASQDWWNDYKVSYANNTWFREAMWEERTLSSVGIDNCYLHELQEGHHGSQATFALSNKGSFSTGTHLPIGALSHKSGKDTWLWQIESSGSWKWEIGDLHDSVYLAASGPTAFDHDWSIDLAPGESFTSVPVACVHIAGPVDSAFAVMTDYRRRILRPHQDHKHLPIIFNDYMNCLMGDPTEDKIKALLTPVAQSGAEYFVIDAGWYADDSDWWDDVGLWEPSKKRFPSGFKTLLDTIRQSGLTPGVWLEPEVVGKRSIVGEQLPEDAFFQDRGKRLLERGRFQLDYRHPAVRARMHGIVDRLVGEYGIGYFKFDYNIQVISGSDFKINESRGAAHLDHQRAYLSWVEEIFDRYPTLVIENCSSGAQRMEYAMLAIHTLQSTSDQQNPNAYAAIAAAVPTAVLPEQSATWAYPQTSWNDETNALTIVNSLLGRVHLSGRLDQLTSTQFDLVKSGMDVYKAIRHQLPTAYAFWPLGLPSWHDDWLALGMTCADGSLLLSVWRRGGPTTKSIPLPIAGTAEVLFPLFATTKTIMKQDDMSLVVTLPEVSCARILRVHTCNTER